MKKRILSTITALALTLTLLPTAAFAADPEPDGSADHPIPLTQSDITQGSTLTLEGGKYYELGGDITIPNPESYIDARAITISGNVSLNLNGYMLKGPGTSSSNCNLRGAITISSGATLTLKDEYNSTRTNVTRYFDVDANGLWTLKDSGTSENSITGGIITGFYGNTGAAVYNNSTLTEYGTFNMTGGTIVGCHAEGGVIVNDGIFNMTGGSIVGCTIVSEGTVDNSGIFNMDGGTIKNCTARGDESEGGGVYNKSNATLDFTNGTITSCKASTGGGVFAEAGGKFNIGGEDSTPGAVSITGNTGGNVYLKYLENKGGYTVLQVTTAGLTAGSSIGVDMEFSNPSFAIITNLTDTGRNCFSSDKNGYSLLYDDSGNAYLVQNYRVTFDVNGGNALDTNYSSTNADGKLTSLPTPTRSGYRFDGWYTEVTGGTKVTTDTVINGNTTLYAHWTELGTSAATPIVLTQSDITQGSTLTLEDGKYYELGEDITIENPESSINARAITISGNVSLNLNGYMLKGPGTSSSNCNLRGAIAIKPGATLTLKDKYNSTRTNVTRYFDVDADGLWTLKDSGTSENSITGGIITGFYGNTGAAVYNDSSRTEYGTFNMTGGTIVGCRAVGGVINNDGTFNMTGGSIVGCTVDDGGIVKNSGTFTMDGGTIKDCTVEKEGGGVRNAEGATFHLVSGTITSCKASTGGGVFAEAGGTFNIGGKGSAPGAVSITGNTDSNVYLEYLKNKGGYTALHVTAAGLTTSSSIGVNMEFSNPSFAIITNLTDTGRNCFSSDKNGYSLLYDDSRNAYLVQNYRVTFDVNGGNALDTNYSSTNANGKLTSLPTPTRSGSYSFDGWFTAATGGEKITTKTVFTAHTTVYAHWTYTGSSGGGSYTPTYTVAAPTNTDNGSISVDTKNAKPGDTVTITLVPDVGYTVETITVLDKNGREIEVTDLGNGKYSFKMPAGKVEIKATFAEDNTMLNFFVDVPADSYYADAVLWAVKNGVTKGITDTTFSPEASCSRAQLVTFLWRVAGCPVVNYAMNFSDVAEDAFCSDAIRWAASLNIVGGYGNGIFGTNDTITREQVVAILYRFAVSQGLDLSAGEDTNILSYNDALQVAEYAMDAFQWACGEGIVKGANGNLMPNDECIRAQIVTMLYRMFG